MDVNFIAWENGAFPPLHHESIIRREDMPTEEELEQLANIMIDRQQELEKAMRESIEKDCIEINGKKITKGGDSK